MFCLVVVGAAETADTTFVDLQNGQIYSEINGRKRNSMEYAKRKPASLIEASIDPLSIHPKALNKFPGALKANQLPPPLRFAALGSDLGEIRMTRWHPGAILAHKNW